jgi:uncharacterized protein (DUF2062 family)
MATVAGSRSLRAMWQRILATLLAQLRQGITARQIALTIALGFALGLFPIFGATTALCLLFGLWLKLNQPIIQLVNWIAAPLQLLGVYFFIRVGEWLTGAPHVRFSLQEFLAAFEASPRQFLQQFAVLGLRGVLAWLLIAPVLVALLYLSLLPLLRRLVAQLEARRS